jgi:hypothetical protein
VSILASKILRTRGTTISTLRLGGTINRSYANQHLPFYFRIYPLLLRPGKRHASDEHDKGSRADPVHQDPPNDVIEAPGREVPVVGRATKIRFGTVGSGFDLARLAWPTEEHVFSSQTSDLGDMLPNRPQVPEVGPPGRLKVGFLQGDNRVDVLLIDLLDDTSWTRIVERAEVNARPQAVVVATSADTLLHASKSSKAKVLRKQMRALGYEVPYWFLRAHEHGAALVQDRLFTGFIRAVPTAPPRWLPWRMVSQCEQGRISSSLLASRAIGCVILSSLHPLTPPCSRQAGP